MIIVITGASKGLGKAMAFQFAAAGHTLLLNARNEAALNKTTNELSKQFPQSIFHSFAADLSVKEQTQSFATWCLQFGATDILINNAGQFLPGSVHNEEDGVLEKMMETNVYSAYNLTRALLPKMMNKKSGHIFNICSIASVAAYANGGSYSISKFAMLGFSKNLREELKPQHIKVTAVLPGAAFTDSWIGSGVDEKRIMEATDVAKMVFAAAQLSPQACVEEILMRPLLGDL
jgi:short-subunit dehydrogenase